ncbi:hypothetical protein R3P38DRAFT_2760810 [Favolaschia claudopus]|uniref:Uncharacterized protein n=1 Tax=Favolaschia claudopus TaxID=2862362 RepID=A0AAW0DS20_9AGAR
MTIDPANANAKLHTEAVREANCFGEVYSRNQLVQGQGSLQERHEGSAQGLLNGAQDDAATTENREAKHRPQGAGSRVIPGENQDSTSSSGAKWRDYRLRYCADDEDRPRHRLGMVEPNLGGAMVIAGHHRREKESGHEKLSGRNGHDFGIKHTKATRTKRASRALTIDEVVMHLHQCMPKPPTSSIYHEQSIERKLEAMDSSTQAALNYGTLSTRSLRQRMGVEWGDAEPRREQCVAYIMRSGVSSFPPTCNSTMTARRDAACPTVLEQSPASSSRDGGRFPLDILRHDDDRRSGPRQTPPVEWHVHQEPTKDENNEGCIQYAVRSGNDQVDTPELVESGCTCTAWNMMQWMKTLAWEGAPLRWKMTLGMPTAEATKSVMANVLRTSVDDLAPEAAPRDDE